MAGDVVFKQLIAVIDERTTVLCLTCAGQVRPLSEPFDTIDGPKDEPPFHWHCRSFVVPWIEGAGDDQGAEARAELKDRDPEKIRWSRQVLSKDDIAVQLAQNRLPKQDPKPALPSLQTPPSFASMADMPPRNVKVLDQLDVEAVDDWRKQDDLEKRAVAVWQWDYDLNQTARQIWMNVESGRDPFDGVSIPQKSIVRYGRGWVRTGDVALDVDEVHGLMTEQDLLDEAYESARVMAQKLRAEGQENGVLYRGMRMNRDDVSFREGDLLEVGPVSFTSSEAEVRQYMVEDGTYRIGDQRVKVVLRSGRTVNLHDAQTGRMGMSNEHVFNGRLEVVRVEERLGEIRIEVREVA